MRSAFSIAQILPLDDPQAALPSRVPIFQTPYGSPKPRAVRKKSERKPCQSENLNQFRWLGDREGCLEGGNKVLLTMFARQLFPSQAVKESFR
jgi:hypothetical protein